MGKILVIKSLAASQLTYILAPLATNNDIIKEINDLFYSYIWNNKGDKIKRSVIIHDDKKGGLRMVDIATFNKSLKTTWIKKNIAMVLTTGNGKNFSILNCENTEEN